MVFPNICRISGSRIGEPGEARDPLLGLVPGPKLSIIRPG
jgi:hypothetical protein